jgi:hypothetical protein
MAGVTWWKFIRLMMEHAPWLVDRIVDLADVIEWLIEMWSRLPPGSPKA